MEAPGGAAPRQVLLLTATIVPPADARSLVRRDAQLRLADYLDAFDFHLRELARGTADALVLCENSGFDLAPFAARAQAAGLADRVELISFQGLDHPAGHGRGYGEFKLVDHAMAHSRLIAAAGDAVTVWKVTGRYKILNLRQLILGKPAGADLYCHCRNRPVRWVDMYLMAWNRAAYDEIIRGVYHRLRQDDTPKSAEQYLREVLDTGSFRARIVRRFRAVPQVDGIRGGDNLNYLAMKNKYRARVLAHRLLPWLWI